MFATLDRKILTKHAQALEKVTGRQLNLDVLKCILIETNKDKVVLRSTNLDIGIEAKISADIKVDGFVAVPATALSGFLENASGERVELSVEKEILKVKSGTATASIKTIPSDDFPTLPITKGSIVSISSEKLARGLRSVWYASSTSNMKPELSSISVSSNGSQLIFAATDSFRLAEKTIQIESVDEFNPLLIPFKNVGEIIRNLDNTQKDTKVKVVASDNQVSFSFDDLFITSRLVDGTFPDYKQIIPNECTTEVIVLKQDLMQALKVTNIFANRFNQVVFSVDPKKKAFVMKTVGGESGESNIKVSASLVGEVVEIGFNQKYITDSFQSLSGDSISLKLSGSSKPMVIKDISDSSFLYLTMPMSR